MQMIFMKLKNLVISKCVTSLIDFKNRRRILALPEIGLNVYISMADCKVNSSFLYMGQFTWFVVIIELSFSDYKKLIHLISLIPSIERNKCNLDYF